MRSTAGDIRRLKSVLRRLTVVLVVISLIALVFTATSVTLFAIRHGVHPGIAWLLDPMVALALGTVLITDGVLSEYGIKPRGWSAVLRYFAGLATWVMNCWSSVWPPETPFGRPEHVDAAGLVLHSIPPVLLIALAEAVTHYRQAILAKVTEMEGERAEDLPRPREAVAAEVPEGPVFEPVPEVYPEPVPAVPEAREVYPQRPPVVPAGVRLLPIRCAPRNEIRNEIPEPPAPDPAPVLAADATRTRDVVHAEYVPLAPGDPWAVDGTYAEDEPTAVPENDDQVLTPDPYTEQALKDHAELLAAGKTPSIRQLRNHYGVGQARAQRIQDELKRIPA